MSTEAGELPQELRTLLDGEDLARRTSLVFELLTVAPSGWPHLALLSVGEVVALGDDSLGLALWPSSTTTDNLRRSGRAVLQLYDDGAAYRIRLAVRGLGDGRAAGGKFALFAAKVEGVVRDAVSYARLTSGPTIDLKEGDRVIARWQAQIETVRDAVARES